MGFLGNMLGCLGRVGLRVPGPGGGRGLGLGGSLGLGESEL